MSFDIVACLGMSCQMNKGLAEAKNIQINLHSNINLDGNVEGDKYKLTQIINNLISNAIKYSDFGVINVSIDCLEDTPQGYLFEISVSDEGIGISKEDLSEIFEPFSQVHTDINISNEGSGLGLAIVQRLITLMGGTIEVESVINEGTKVSMLIPFQKSNKEDVLNDENDMDAALKRGLVFYDESAELSKHIKHSGFQCFSDKEELYQSFRYKQINVFVINFDRKDISVKSFL